MVTINKEFALGAGEGDSRKAQNMYIILHETANPKSTGRNEATYMHNNYQNAYTQFIVGDGLVYQVGEPGYVAWGALNGNPYSPVQIELQHTSDPALFKKNYAIYIELARDMANKYGIPLSLDAGGAGTKGIKTHNWITQNYGGDHTDPYGYLASMGVSKAKLASDLASGSGIVADTGDHGSIDVLTVGNGALNVVGWSISNKSVTMPYSYLFIMDKASGKEIQRYPITRVKRQDDKKAYPNVKNSENSGFNFSMPVPIGAFGKEIYIKVRYSADKTGSTKYVDYDGKSIKVPSQESYGAIDVLIQQGSSIKVVGWHAVKFAKIMPNRFAFLMDKTTGKEIQRVKVKSIVREDVKKAYPNLDTPENSGFDVSFDAKKAKDKKVFVLLRYSADASGNYYCVDYSDKNKNITVK